MPRRSAKQDRIDDRLREILWECNTWGELERAAGVEDRDEFWRGKSEAQAREALTALIRQRLESEE